jgi:hypothetical protein
LGSLSWKAANRRLIVWKGDYVYQMPRTTDLFA